MLDRLKLDLATRHIPVQVITIEHDSEPGLTQGALGYLVKPEDKEKLEAAFDGLKEFIDRPMRNLLLVEDDEIQQMSIRELIGNGEVRTTVVGTGQDALKALHSQKFDCMVLDLGLPDMPGVELLERIKNEEQSRTMPIIIYTARDLLKEEKAAAPAAACREYSCSRTCARPSGCWDETALLLHRNAAKLPDRQRKMLETLHQGVLEGKKVLLVDDDIRNIFAMTSVLERFKMNVISAENGKDAIALLLENRDTDIVLMDIMLPTMDGYATMRAIREISDFHHLPIIAVTAKAMKGDREKMHQRAGASDYLSEAAGRYGTIALRVATLAASLTRHEPG